MSPIDAPGALTARLRELSRLSDLRRSERLATNVDVSPAAVTRRLRRLSELRDYCLRVGRWGRRVGAAAGTLF